MISVTSLPEWTKKVFPTVEIDFLSQMLYTVESYTPTLAKIRSGFLLKDILDRSTLKSNGTLSPDLSVMVYSSHDNVLSNLMYSMNISNVSFPFNSMNIIIIIFVT